MGLDGGTKITRSDVLRGQSWKVTSADSSCSTRGGSVSGVFREEQIDERTRRNTKWCFCSISGLPLQKPVVCDWLGNLYNKDAVVEYLLGKQSVFQDKEAEHRYINLLRTSASALSHLNNMKDVFEVKLYTEISGSGIGGAADAGEQDGGRPEVLCPITQLPCHKHAFSALSGCGHVFAERAIREMRDSCCSLCGRAFTAAEIVPVNGSEEQKRQLQQQLSSRSLTAASKKKRKDKRKRLEAATENAI